MYMNIDVTFMHSHLQTGNTCILSTFLETHVQSAVVVVLSIPLKITLYKLQFQKNVIQFWLTLFFKNSGLNTASSCTSTLKSVCGRIFIEIA